MAAGHRENSASVEALHQSGLFTTPVLDSAGGEAEAAQQRGNLTAVMCTRFRMTRAMSVVPTRCRSSRIRISERWHRADRIRVNV
jgi:hypothetical protein